MWTNIVEFGEWIRPLADAVGIALFVPLIGIIVVAAMFRWISYLYRLRQEEDSKGGHWGPRR